HIRNRRFKPSKGDQVLSMRSNSRRIQNILVTHTTIQDIRISHRPPFQFLDQRDLIEQKSLKMMPVPQRDIPVTGKFKEIHQAVSRRGIKERLIAQMIFQKRIRYLTSNHSSVEFIPG